MQLVWIEPHKTDGHYRARQSGDLIRVNQPSKDLP